MKPFPKVRLQDLQGDLHTYFNWSANALMPIRRGAAHRFLMENRLVIHSTAQRLLKQMNYSPQTLYRGIILREPVEQIAPHPKFTYLSFSADPVVAAHFGNYNGFGSNLVNVAEQLGKFGYVIPYKPAFREILFHYRFLSFLPYAEAFTLIGVDGLGQVENLKRQKEIVIFQPSFPFTNIKKVLQ